MVTPFRIPFLLSLPLLLGAAALILGPVLAQPARGQDRDESEVVCAATGYLVESRAELQRLRDQLAEQPVQEQRGGTPLRSGQTWVIPDGEQPVVLIDSTTPLSGGTVSISIAGETYEAATSTSTQADGRYVSNVYLPHLGSVVRILGLSVESGPCQLSVTLAVEKRIWSTVVGASAIGVAVVFGLLTVLVARLRRGGWLRRFLFAAPLGLIAGAGQAAVLVEAGASSPFDPPPYWLPVAGVLVAAVLPLTRWRRGAGGVVPAAEPATVAFPPAQAPLGEYRIEEAAARTEVAGIYRAGREPDGERALVKIALPERYGEPAARLRLEREARLLSGLHHPHILRLRETVRPPTAPAPPPDPDQTVPDGPTADPVAGSMAGSMAGTTAAASAPPTLVFEDVDGAPLRRLLAGGALTGPQVVTVVLGVLAGLEQVHARELVHRDVRPENVWLGNDGRVLLAGFEVASPGIEHPVAPEGAAPYASPEQLARQPLDPRCDLYACGVLLAELLAGTPPAGPGTAPDGLPEPLAAVLGRALAAEPSARPASARQFIEELREAAGQAFGADWLGRGALAGALVVHGGIATGAAGYALGGVTVGTGGGGAGGGATAAGLGSAPGAAGAGASDAVAQTAQAAASPAAQAAASPAAQAAGQTAAQTTAQTTAQVAGQATAGAGGQAATGPVGALINAAVAAVAVAGIVAAVVVIDPGASQAQESVVITPDQAQVIFVRTMGEGWEDTFAHFDEDSQADFEFLLAQDDAIADGQLVDVVVGVPPEQYDYPAWFVATALIRYEEGSASLFARFDREAAAEPWLMTTMEWSLSRLQPPPLLGPDGWLAPAPGVADLLVDPQSLPERYRDWLVRADDARTLVEDDVMVLRYPDAGIVRLLGTEEQLYVGDNPGRVSSEHSIELGEVRTDLVPLVDGTVHVTFTAVVHRILYNRPNLTPGPCDDFSLRFGDPPGDPPGRFRTLERDMVVLVDAWIPVVDAVPEPSPAPSPTPDQENPDQEDQEDQEDSDELALEPVNPAVVVIEDWYWVSENEQGIPC